jgi:hypothetical protein
MKFVEDEKCGDYMNVIKEIKYEEGKNVNIYNEKLIMWRLKKVNYGYV